MLTEPALSETPSSPSARLVAAFLFWYLAAWAALTVSTLLAQFIHIAFKYYAVFSAFLIAGALVGFMREVRRSVLIRRESRGAFDWGIAAGLGILVLLTAAVSLSYHIAGLVALDDFYLVANPTFYAQHPQAAMSFEARAFYSGGMPITSVGFLTAGAYEIILAVPAYLLRIPYLVVYYRLAAAFNSLLLVSSLFFAISHLSARPRDSLIGTGIALGALAVMSENRWAIGELAFLNAYEGKVLLIMSGIPLMAAYSLEMLEGPSRRTWLKLFLLVTALTGMSTSSLMVLPISGVILFLASGLAGYWPIASPTAWARRAIPYLAACSYLILFALLLTLTDKVQNAVAFNLDYPGSFSGYVQDYVSSSTWPATPLLSILGWAAATVLLTRRRRVFIASWGILSIVLALNPLSAKLLLLVFRGIYFRLFYILFHPLFLGIAAAALLAKLALHYGARRQTGAAVSLIVLALAAGILSPSSLFVNPRFSFGGWSPTDDFGAAQKIINNVPEGLMLAPYPLSGTIRMISSDYPQLEGRSDMVSFYLGQQGRAAEASSRTAANAFLLGDASSITPLASLLDKYPQVRSLVFSRSSFLMTDSSSLDTFLKNQGFVHHQAVGKYIAYWR